jgi:hypothetical protein
MYTPLEAIWATILTVAPTPRRYPHPMPRDSIAGTVSDLASDTARLVQLEIELAQQEITALLWRNVIAIGLLLGAGILAFLGLVFIFDTIVEAVPIPHWITALVLAVIFIIGALVLALVGRARLKFAPPVATIQSLKEDLEWVKQQIRPETR